MANYFTIFPVPIPHLEFLKSHPEVLYDYYQGEQPKLKQAPIAKPSLWQRLTGKSLSSATGTSVPADWPMEEVVEIGPEINHRNVDLHHSILNGTMDAVSGSGSIFQSWFMQEHSAINLEGESFAFSNEQLPELAQLLSLVEPPKVMLGYKRWLSSQGDNYEPSEEECKEIANEYRRFHTAIKEAIKQNQGLIRIAC